MNPEPQVTTWRPTHRPANVRLVVEQMYPELPLRFPLYTVRIDGQVRNADAQTLRELAAWCNWKADRMERYAATASDAE